MPSQFLPAINFVLLYEGGLIDNPNDPGGLTNFGIALSKHPELTADQIRSLTKDAAIAIYQKSYWDQRIEALNSQDLANRLFDTIVNLGSFAAWHIFSKCLGKDVSIPVIDLIALANKANSDTLLTEFRAQRAYSYLSLVVARPADKIFALGWLRRAVA